MCLAIAPDSQRSNSLFARNWRRLSSTPLRLFTFGAVFHLLSFAGILLAGNISHMPVNSHALAFAFAYGIAAFIIFGFIMSLLPKSYAVSPVRYGRYNSIYLFMSVALLLLEAGALLGEAMIIAGLVLMIPAWLITLQGLRNMHDWLPSDSQHLSGFIGRMSGLIFACLLVSLVGTLSGGYQEIAVIAVSIGLISWLPIAIAFKVLLSKAPARSRVISV